MKTQLRVLCICASSLYVRLGTGVHVCRDGGIFRPVTLLGIETARLDSVYIRQVHKDGKVLLVPEVDVETVDEEESEADGV